MILSMSVVQSLALALEPLVPLHVRAIEYEDPTLVVLGERWSLAITCPWVWRHEGEVKAGWGEPFAADAVWDLCGLSFVAVQSRDRQGAREVSFVLSDGGFLELTPGDGWDSWSFQHDDLDQVFVGQ